MVTFIIQSSALFVTVSMMLISTAIKAEDCPADGLMKVASSCLPLQSQLPALLAVMGDLTKLQDKTGTYTSAEITKLRESATALCKSSDQVLNCLKILGKCPNVLGMLGGLGGALPPNLNEIISDGAALLTTMCTNKALSQYVDCVERNNGVNMRPACSSYKAPAFGDFSSSFSGFSNLLPGSKPAPTTAPPDPLDCRQFTLASGCMASQLKKYCGKDLADSMYSVSKIQGKFGKPTCQIPATADAAEAEYAKSAPTTTVAAATTTSTTTTTTKPTTVIATKATVTTTKATVTMTKTTVTTANTPKTNPPTAAATAAKTIPTTTTTTTLATTASTAEQTDAATMANTVPSSRATRTRPTTRRTTTTTDLPECEDDVIFPMDMDVTDIHLMPIATTTKSPKSAAKIPSDAEAKLIPDPPRKFAPTVPQKMVPQVPEKATTVEVTEEPAADEETTEPPTLPSTVTTTTTTVTTTSASTTTESTTETTTLTMTEQQTTTTSQLMEQSSQSATTRPYQKPQGTTLSDAIAIPLYLYDWSDDDERNHFSENAAARTVLSTPLLFTVALSPIFCFVLSQ